MPNNRCKQRHSNITVTQIWHSSSRLHVLGIMPRCPKTLCFLGRVNWNLLSCWAAITRTDLCESSVRANVQMCALWKQSWGERESIGHTWPSWLGARWNVTVCGGLLTRSACVSVCVYQDWLNSPLALNTEKALSCELWTLKKKSCAQ